MLATLLMRAPLGVVVDLRLVVVHRGHGTVVEDGLGQGEHTSANHQGVGRCAGLGVAYGRAEGQRLTIDRYVDDEGVTNHAGLDLLLGYGRFAADAVVLYLGSYLATTALPLAEVGDTARAIAPCQYVGQRGYHGQLVGVGQ